MPAINRGLGDPEVLFGLVEFLAAQGARPHQPQAPLEVGPGAVARGLPGPQGGGPPPRGRGDRLAQRYGTGCRANGDMIASFTVEETGYTP